MKIFEDKEKLLHSISVLYVEDDAPTREAMSSFLQIGLNNLIEQLK